MCMYLPSRSECLSKQPEPNCLLTLRSTITLRSIFHKLIINSWTRNPLHFTIASSLQIWMTSCSTICYRVWLHSFCYLSVAFGSHFSIFYQLDKMPTKWITAACLTFYTDLELCSLSSIFQPVCITFCIYLHDYEW